MQPASMFTLSARQARHCIQCLGLKKLRRNKHLAYRCLCYVWMRYTTRPFAEQCSLSAMALLQLPCSSFKTLELSFRMYEAHL